MKESPNKIVQAPLATDPFGQINTGSFTPNAQVAAQQIYGSEYDRTMAMPSRGLTPEQVMANTPLSMMVSPLDKALVGDKDKLPQEHKDAIEKA